MDRRTYFDDLSSRWDSFTDGAMVRRKLAAMLVPYGIQPDEHIIDLGCGTGNLAQVLCTCLGPGGTVTAVDIAPSMLEVASRNLRDTRVRWLAADALALPLEERSVDRVICFSAWPHFPDPGKVARELARVLRVQGALHILHIDGKEKINAVHAGVGGAIGQDMLPPASQLVAMLGGAGLQPFEEIDVPDGYRVSARRIA